MKKILLLALASVCSFLEAEGLRKSSALSRNAVAAKFDNLDEGLQSEVLRIEEWFERFNEGEKAQILNAIEKSKGAPSACNRFIGCIFIASLLTAATGSMKKSGWDKSSNVLFKTPKVKSIDEKPVKEEDVYKLVRVLNAAFLVATPCYWTKAVWKDHSKESDSFIEKKTLVTDGTDAKESANRARIRFNMDADSLPSFFIDMVINYVVEVIFEKALKSKRTALNKPIHELFKKWALESQEHKKRNAIIDFVLQFEKQA